MGYASVQILAARKRLSVSSMIRSQNINQVHGGYSSMVEHGSPNKTLVVQETPVRTAEWKDAKGEPGEGSIAANIVYEV